MPKEFYITGDGRLGPGRFVCRRKVNGEPCRKEWKCRSGRNDHERRHRQDDEDIAYMAEVSKKTAADWIKHNADIAAGKRVAKTYDCRRKNKDGTPCTKGGYKQPSHRRKHEIYHMDTEKDRLAVAKVQKDGRKWVNQLRKKEAHLKIMSVKDAQLMDVISDTMEQIARRFTGAEIALCLALVKTAARSEEDQLRHCQFWGMMKAALAAAGYRTFEAYKFIKPLYDPRIRETNFVKVSLSQSDYDQIATLSRWIPHEVSRLTGKSMSAVWYWTSFHKTTISEATGLAWDTLLHNAIQEMQSYWISFTAACQAAFPLSQAELNEVLPQIDERELVNEDEDVEEEDGDSDGPVAGPSTLTNAITIDSDTEIDEEPF